MASLATRAGGKSSSARFLKRIFDSFLRWVYIIEGIFSIVIAIAVWFGLPTNPAEAYFLNAEEKAMMRLRYAQRKQYMGSEDFSWEEVRIAFKDPKLYLRYSLQPQEISHGMC